MTKVASTVAAVSVLLATLAGTAGAAPKKWYWTEAHAERVMVAKVRVPCVRVYPATDRRCDVAKAEAAASSATDPAAGCANKLDEASRQDCILMAAYNTDRVATWLRHARTGYAVKTADCTGKDEKGDTFTFTRFECKAVLEEDTAHGRIALYVTGPATFRWKILPRN